jgi:hypothetical protein
MDLCFSQSGLFFYLSFQFLILHLLISVCTQSHHLFFGRPLSLLSWGLLLVNTRLTFLLLSILLTWPIQFNRLILTNECISDSPNSCINPLNAKLRVNPICHLLALLVAHPILHVSRIRVNSMLYCFLQFSFIFILILILILLKTFL